MTRVVWKWTKWISIFLVGLLLSITLLTAGLLLTNTGLKVALWGAEKALPQLKVGEVQGALFPRFTLNQVAFSDESLKMEVNAQRLTLAVNGNCLLEPMLCVNELIVDGLDFSMPELTGNNNNTSSPDSEPVRSVTTPFPIRVGNIMLNNIRLNVLGNEVEWKQFSTGATFQGNRLRIGKTVWNDVTVALPAAVESGGQVAEAPQKTVNSPRDPLILPDVLIPLNIELSRFDLNRFMLQQETPVIINHLGLEAQAYNYDVTIRKLELDAPEADALLAAKVRLSQEYPLNLTLNTRIKQQEAKGQTLELNASGSAANLSLNATLGGLASATLKANIQALKPEIPFDIQLSKVKAQWPLTGKGEYFVDLPELKSKGSLDGYTLALSTKLKGKDVPDVDLSLKGKGTLSEIDLQSLLIKTLGGTVSGQASAGWAAPIHWKASLSLDNIQPGLQWPEAEGNISGGLTTSGELTEQGGWLAELPTLDINGVVRNYPLNIVGAVSASDRTGKGDYRVKTSGLTLAHGPNRLTAKGELDKEWRMALGVDLPDLAKSVPDLKGKVIGDVVLRGALKEPKVKLALNADAVAWQDLATLKHLTLTGDVTPLPTPQADLRLEASDMRYDENRVSRLKVNLSGSQQQHLLTLDVASNIVSASLALSGSLKDEPSMIWNGRLDRVALKSEQGPWNLSKPTAVSVNIDKQRATVAAHCWLQEGSSLCLEQDATVGQSGEAKLALNRFDFRQIASFLPPELQISGQADAHVWAKWSEKAAPEAKVELALAPGKLVQQQEQKEAMQIGWNKAVVNAELAKNRLKVDWLLDVADNGNLSGYLTIPDVMKENKQVDGHLKLDTFNLDFLAPVIGEFSEVKSSIETDIDFTGDVMHPQIFGQLSVDQIRVSGDISPVEVKSGRVTVNFSGYQAVLESKIQTVDGELNVTGNGDWARMDDWKLNARVFADSLAVDSPPMVKLKVAPDMTLTMTPDLAKVSGDVSIPWGRITVDELPPSAVRVSDDQVILDMSGKPVNEEQPIPLIVETDINVNIGNDVRLTAFGLKGNLQGRLKVTQKDKGPFINGEVNILDGSYRSFGQDLIIREGKILMNGPADKPYVAITAIRNPDNTQDDVVAGVKVSGPAETPQVTIFSDPVMPQANALSYLLRGQDIDSESGGNAMTTTLIGLSLAKSGKVVGEIGQAFGVEDLQLDTAGSGDESQVTVSGYIMPGLQVKYGRGIFNSVGEFTVRYRLMKNLYIEAVSGLDSAVDLLYQFEFK